MLFHLLLLLMLSDRSECLTVGKEIIAAFPENIARYHPIPSENKLRVIALHDGTQVTITSTFAEAGGSTYSDSGHLQSGEIHEFSVNATLELDKMNVSAKVVTITGSKDIAVEILSLRRNSIQTALLLPTDQLGEKYQVPPIPQMSQTGPTTEDETERSPFKLIIVNNKEANTITLDGTGGDPFFLEPGQVLQLWVYQDMVGKVVTGTTPFMALFGHSCAMQHDCTCGVLYTPLQPLNSNALRFIVPSVFSDEAEGQTYLLKPSVSQPVQFASNSDGSFKVSGPLVLHRPGLLLNLIPEAEFGSCFAVHTVSNASLNWAVIVALAASTADVQIGNSPVEGDWNSIPGTDFKYIKVQLNSGKNIIWHKSGLMAVWFLGKKNETKNAWFGNPAARLSKDPDHRGCVLQTEKFEVLQEEGSWQEAIQACRNRSLALISLPDQTFQNYVYSHILDLKMNQNLMELWIGLRKSSYSGKWYWISEDPLKHVDWSQGSPGDADREECGRISLKDSRDPGWIHRDCCSRAKAVCYQPPKLLKI